MPRNPSRQPNDVELAILQVVGKLKKCSVRDVHEALLSERQTGYTSTLKMMQVMRDKGLLRRDDSQRPQLYSLAVPQAQTEKKIVQDLVQKVFGGSVHRLLMYAVKSQKISSEELSEIRNLLDQMEKGR